MTSPHEGRRDNERDQEVIGRVTALQADLERWIKANDLWHDCGFATHLEYVDCEPDPQPVVLILWYEGPLIQVLRYHNLLDLYDEFRDLVKSHGFEFESRDNTTTEFRPAYESDYSAFYEFYHWQWVCSQITPDCDDVFEEIYAHFQNRPEDLHDLHWRSFETLLFRVFQNQGFTAQLGPGSGDEGVDIRFLQRDPLGDILTVVQAKKYAKHRKVDLQAVQALHGAAKVEGATNAIFITTSDYQPVAKRWAGRTSGELTLANKDAVQLWCSEAAETVIEDKSRLTSRSSVERILLECRHGRSSSIVHAHSGYGIVANNFALVIKETKHAALLMKLGQRTIEHDGYGTRGKEIPHIGQDALKMLNEEGVFRAKRSVSDGRVDYWDGNNLFSTWDGNAKHFDWND